MAELQLNVGWIFLIIFHSLNWMNLWLCQIMFMVFWKLINPILRLYNNHPPPFNKLGTQSQNLASIVRGYKSGVKKYATINKIVFCRQFRFHDHIIRNDEEYNRISNYIVENPNNCEQDKFFKSE